MTNAIYRTASQVNSAMTGVYFQMFLAVLTSMVTAMFISSTPALMAVLFGTFLKWVVLFLPLVAVFAVTILLNTDPPKSVAVMALHGFAVLMGLSLSSVFVIYTSLSLISAFMGAAVLFGTMTFYGYFTKRSLQSFGQYLFVALIAIILASIINIFIGSTVLQMIVSAIAIVVFMGLTAHDTQNIREMIMNGNSNPGLEVLGALSLYLNFINIFISLLNLFGEKD